MVVVLVEFVGDVKFVAVVEFKSAVAFVISVAGVIVGVMFSVIFRCMSQHESHEEGNTMQSDSFVAFLACRTYAGAEVTRAVCSAAVNMTTAAASVQKLDILQKRFLG